MRSVICHCCPYRYKNTNAEPKQYHNGGSRACRPLCYSRSHVTDMAVVNLLVRSQTPAVRESRMHCVMFTVTCYICTFQSNTSDFSKCTLSYKLFILGDQCVADSFNFG
ncbi:hypothetical protein BsWGS_03359 [Bradybaena similaris]